MITVPGSDQTKVAQIEPAPSAEHFRPYSQRVWRMVEAQHRISTNRLSASAVDQLLLEQMVEEVKPQLPEAVHHLDWLLAAPFRYGHSQPSRFRRANERPGIFYASEAVVTAVAETAYWRLRFFSRSPGMALPTTTSEHSAFTVAVNAISGLDLTTPPYSNAAEAWMRPDDYEPCQRFATAARALDVQLIRYTSVRDPAQGANLAIVDPGAFADHTPMIEQTWHLRYEQRRLTAFAAFPVRERYNFSFDQFDLAFMDET